MYFVALTCFKEQNKVEYIYYIGTRYILRLYFFYKKNWDILQCLVLFYYFLLIKKVKVSLILIVVKRI